VPDRRGSRFLFEVLFLAGLAAALAFAHLRATEIAGAMLLGWVLVAVLEWGAWRGRPHYGSGLPPRYYVPRLNLPPGRPVQGTWTGFPAIKPAEEPTWIVSPTMRTEVMGEWPLAARGVADPQQLGETDPWLATSLPVAPLEPGAAAPEVAEPNRAAWDVVIAARAREGTRALHTLDLLAEPPKRKRGGGRDQALRIEVSARPPGTRPLPSRLTGQGQG
jgi:hypothetical protein